jgi:lysyl-tRNA synthetase class I
MNIGFTIKKIHNGPETPEENEMLTERIEYAQKYLKNYAGKDEKVVFNKSVPKSLNLTNIQKIFITELNTLLLKESTADRESVQQMVFDVLKKNNLKPKEVFPGFYRLLISKEFGPKAADLILEYGLQKTTALFSAALSNTKEQAPLKKEKKSGFPTITDSYIFSINKEVTTKFPSVSIGIAIIEVFSY